MSISNGLGQSFYYGGYDLSGDTGSADDIGGGLAGTQDTTPINKSAFRRTGLLRDGRISWMSFFNDAVGAAHSRLSALPTADRQLMWLTGSTIGDPAACMVGKQINYDPTRPQDGSLTIAVNAQANGYGLEWCDLLTAGVRTDTVATNGASLDLGTGSTAFGLQAYLQVLAFTGTTVTIKLQESSDNGAGDAWADVTGGAFTAVTAGPTVERIQTGRSQTVERYLRVATTGTFSNVQFVVAVNRPDVEVLF
ncbi:hypothetical protein [Streptomyces cupreus]|uniref:Uncharacterized protein n=1 Tax=Streptomyces cupreus TaxID=2759956 RepID=A0A7X1J417_9ACTN|nr:hypothetical protein [Streptomyces cupreus]MBC2903140.1 hypothetical protein [Streptomyces cupreus]